ncbi:hypothetical protein ABT120_18935 [Nonomuraea angiospora]
MKMIVLDAMGVLYRYGNVQGRVLIPYLRAHGCAAAWSAILRRR